MRTFLTILAMWSLIASMKALPSGEPSDMKWEEWEKFQEENFVAGDPLTEEEFEEAKSAKAGFEIPSTDGETLQTGLVGGDMLLPGSKNFIDFSVYKSNKWPNGQVPYVISAAMTSTQRTMIAQAMSRYHNSTCIRFVPRTTQADYVRIVKDSSGCFSNVGKVGGAQTLNLQDGCSLGNAQHEMMHTLGYFHEHSRPDQSKNVVINYSNIIAGAEGNFKPVSASWVNIQNVPYDFDSIMHYGATFFAINPSIATIKPISSSININRMGQRNGFSDWDVKKIKIAYCGGV